MKNNYIYNILKNIYLKNPLSTAIEIEDVKINYKSFFEDCLNFASYINFNKYETIGIIGDYEYVNYIAIFGTLIAGKTYVPINQNLPIKKIKKILSVSKIKVLVISKIKEKKFKDINVKKIDYKSIIKKEKIINKKFTVSKNAYIIFTSGSTGQPKGVPIERKSLFHYINWLKNNFAIKKNNRCSQFPNIGFDLSVVDIFATICSGGTLVIPKNLFYRNFPAKFIKEKKITHLVCVPSFVDIISNSLQINKENLISLKKIFFCGEPLYEMQLKKLFSVNKNLKIINAYGPTETTVSCTKLNLNKNNFKKYCNGTASIGKSIKGMKIKLLKFSKNEEKNLEILISGPQVFNGYLNNEKLSNKKFINIDDKIYFKTGDIVEVINKNIYFKKRMDAQVKIKGYRVELDEIDGFIRKYGIQQTKTFYKNLKLISFIVYKKNLIPKLKKYLKLVLPVYMLPSDIINLKSFPKNHNDKIDIKKLENYLNIYEK
mgnify:CR=1 FL=1|jgi:D-alanine--poly(phosphoribitol) ligase subunit 1